MEKKRSRKDYYNPNPKNGSDAIEQLVLANRVLPNEGILDYLGHVSVRNPERRNTFFIAHSIAPEQVTREDILEVDFEGNVLTPSTEKPYGERIIHAAIFKARPDVNCVIHAHPRPIVILSITDMPVRILYHPASVFFEGVPLFDDYDMSPSGSGMLIKSKEEGERVARALGKARGMLMRGHGCNVVGESVPHAVRAAIDLRDNVSLQLAAQQFGQIKGLSREEARVASGSLSDPKRGWNYWVAKVKGDIRPLES